jgi:uridine kinase
VIGVGGGSGAGKGALVGALCRHAGRVAVLDLDSYYLDRGGVAPDERARINFDEPSAIDADLVAEHVATLACGTAVAKPVYSFVTHSRIGVVTVGPAPVVVVEGLFTLWWAPLRELLDVAVYVDAPADLRLARRLERDVRERGRDLESVLRQYTATVRPMHQRYVEPTRGYADVVIVNDGDLDTSVGAFVKVAETIVTATA